MRLMNSNKSAVGPINSNKNKLNSKISFTKRTLLGLNLEGSLSLHLYIKKKTKKSVVLPNNQITSRNK